MQTADFVSLVGLKMKDDFFYPKSVFIKNDYLLLPIPVSNSKVSFCGVQRQIGKLVFDKSGVLHIWHIVSSVAQVQNVVNVYKLACRYTKV